MTGALAPCAAPPHAPAPAHPVERPWCEQWRIRHARAAALLLCLSITAVLAFSAELHPGLGAQIVALVTAVAIFGVPHGALDPLVGRRWLAPRLGPRWWLPFHAVYLALVAAVVLAWIYAPTATLAAFLTASALHFGLGDVDYVRAPRRLAWAEVLVRGAAPIVVPALAHPAAVRQAFAWVAPGAAAPALAAIVATSAWCARWIVIPGCVLSAAAHALAARRATLRAGAPAARTHPSDAVECLAVPAVAAVLPPFVAFLVYFCLLHSARHALALAATLDPARPRRAWARFARAALPATAATLALGAAAWAALTHVMSAPRAPAAVRVLFAGLAALTAPHMLLTFLAGEELTGRGRAAP